MTKTSPSKFPLGQVVITANAAQHLDILAVKGALHRHASGDWGDICPEDASENEHSLKEGNRLMSVYGAGEDRFWIITEADPLGHDHPDAGRLLTNGAGLDRPSSERSRTMTLYNIHIYREMRLFFPGIEAATPEEAAKIAADKLSEDAEYTEDCQGENLAALVDLVGDHEFEQSVTIDFEAERLRKAAPQLLAALQAASDWIDAQVFVPRTGIQTTIQAAITKATADISEGSPL